MLGKGASILISFVLLALVSCCFLGIRGVKKLKLAVGLEPNSDLIYFAGDVEFQLCDPYEDLTQKKLGDLDKNLIEIASVLTELPPRERIAREEQVRLLIANWKELHEHLLAYRTARNKQVMGSAELEAEQMLNIADRIRTRVGELK